MLDQRGQLLRAALGFAGLPRPSYDLSLWALRAWLDSWSGIGHVAVGMHRQGFDLQLTQYDECGWRAGAFDGEGAGRGQTSRRVGATGGRDGENIFYGAMLRIDRERLRTLSPKLVAEYEAAR